DFVDGVVDDVVVTQVNTVVLGQLLGALFSTHVEADNDCIGSDCQVDVAFRNTADSRVNDLYADFVSGKLDQGLYQRFLRTLNVGFDDQRQSLLTFTHVLEHGLELGSLLTRQFDVTVLALTEQSKFPRLAFISHGDEFIAGLRNIGKTLNVDRDRWASLSDALALIAQHGQKPPKARTDQYRIAAT